MICASCGLEKPRLDFGGHPWCAACEKAYEPEHRDGMIRAANEPCYDHRKAIGQCQYCNNPARPGKVFCDLRPTPRLNRVVLVTSAL